MKKSMKAKRQPAVAVSAPPVLPLPVAALKPSAQMPERHKSAGRKGQKGSR